jgi:hypothetical protein
MGQRTAKRSAKTNAFDFFRKLFTRATKRAEFN